MTAYFARDAWIHDGLQPYWASNVRFEVDERGMLQKVTPGGELQGAQLLNGPVLPGLVDAHSHAFQRAMAGLTEIAGPAEDNFWTWRALMYDFANRLNPAEFEAIAYQLYIELLKGGYTTVCEFHYVHHDARGQHYADPAELAWRIDRAAERAGIALTLLPVLYMSSGFGGQPPHPGQRRFLSDPDWIIELVNTLRTRFNGSPLRRVGAAPHSLRAVPPEALSALVSGLRAADPEAPIHIHVAEQIGEVDGCVQWCGRRPVAWLLDEMPVDRHWSLVHATHLSDDEVRRLAGSGAVAVLCPTTEANLGDGIFRLTDYRGAGGRLAVGSDSQICRSGVSELQWLEYGQRLAQRRRNVMAAGPGGSTGAMLYQLACEGGAQAAGQKVGRLAPGYRADWLVLDADHSTLFERSGDRWLDGLLFGEAGALGNNRHTPIRDVFVAGNPVIKDGRHPGETEALSTFRLALRQLTGQPSTPAILSPLPQQERNEDDKRRQRQQRGFAQ